MVTSSDNTNGNSSTGSLIPPAPGPGRPQPAQDVLTTAIDALQAIGDDVQRGIKALQALGGRPVLPVQPLASRMISGSVTLRTMSANVAANTTLRPGDEIVSSAGNAKLSFQTDGNLVVYVRRSGVLPTGGASGDWVARWASNTNGKPAATCTMQGDGNLVIYNAQGKPLWASNTSGHPGATLSVQDDENVVIYQGSTALWATNTWIGGVAHSNFNPATMGFHFVNNFPDGYWQFGTLKFATAGLCGGMSFSALDYYYAKMPIPAATSTPSAVNDALGQYINARQQESVVNNLGGWAVQILNPDDHALNYWATHDEWTKIKSHIDSGDPAPIGLGIYLNGGSSHQVVAVGYREGARERWIYTYDSNNPNAESYVHLGPDRLHWDDEQGGDWRGFFVESYSPKQPPAV